MFDEFIHKVDNYIHVQWDEFLFSCLDNEIFIYRNIETYKFIKSLPEEEKRKDWYEFKFLNPSCENFLDETHFLWWWILSIRRIITLKSHKVFFMK